MSRRGATKKAAAEKAVTSGHGAKYVEHQAWMLTPPWITAGGLYAAAEAGHLLLAGDPINLAWGAVGLTCSTGTLALVTHIAGQARGPVVRIHATATVGAGGAWMIIGTIVGPIHQGLALTYLGVAGTLAASWNIRRLLRGQGDTDQRPSRWDEISDSVQTLKSKVGAIRVEATTAKVELGIPDGVTAAEVQADAPRLEQLLGTKPGGVRVVTDPDDASRVELHITPVDMLREMIPWPGPVAAGRSVSVPVALGRYEDSEDVALVLPGIFGRQSMSHVLVVGMTGAGKSELLQVLVAELGTRRDVVIDYLDVAGKAEQTVGPIRQAIRTLVTDRVEAERYLRLRLCEVPDRARVLAAQGMREWREGATVPFEIIIIDEGASLVSESSDFVEIVRLFRSVGILVVVGMQRATYDQMPTSARANFGTVLCFGVRTAADAKTALSGETIDAGAAPENWRNRKPGYLYLEAPGVDPDRYAMPARAYLAQAGDVERILGEATHLRYQVDPAATTIKPPGSGTAAGVGPAAGPPAAGEDHDPEGSRKGGETSHPDDGLSYTPPDGVSAELDRADPDADLTIPESMDMNRLLGPPLPVLTAEQAEEMFDTFIRSYRDASGGGQFRRRDLLAAGVVQATGRRQGWISGALGRRVDAGVLVRIGDREDGIYAYSE